MTTHPSFYLSPQIVRRIDLSSRRWPDGRSVECSRRRSSATTCSVICDAATAQDLMHRISDVAARSDEQSFRQQCLEAVDAIRRALEDGGDSSAVIAQTSSDKSRGVLGL